MIKRLSLILSGILIALSVGIFADWYTPSGVPATGSQGSSAAMRGEFNSIGTAMAKLPTYTGNGSKAVFVNSGGTALESVTASSARTNLGLVIGTDVQAYDADLASWAAITRAAGVDTFTTTPSSANFASLITDETGSGSVVLATSPTLVTPALGTPSAVTLTNGTGLPISTGVSGLGTNVATFLATPTSFNLAQAITNETGNGSLVFGTGPTITGATLNSPAISASTITTSAIDSTTVGGTTPAAGYFTSLSATGAVLISGTVTPNKSCNSGYSRVGVNHCRKDSDASLGSPTRDACTSFSVPSGTTEGVTLLVNVNIKSANSIAARYVQFVTYSDASCVTPVQQANFNDYEFVATASGTTIGGAVAILFAPNVSGSYYYKYTDDAGNTSTVVPFLTGYYD